MAKSVSVTAKQITRGLVHYLEKTHHQGLLPQVLRQVQQAARGNRDPNIAVIETVIPLSPTQLASLTQTLSEKVNRPLTVKNILNPALLAGMRIKIGDLLIDQSFNRQIDQLVTALRS